VKAVIFGAGGLLGQALVESLPVAGYVICGAYRGRGEADIADAGRVQEIFAEHRPEIVFNAAAFTDVDGAEDQVEASFRANAIGPGVLAQACAAGGARLLHYSTDFVFDGESAVPYDELAAPGPQSVYAQGKREGEIRVLAAHPRAQILRVGCLYGRGGRNFPSTLLRRLRAGETIRADNERRVSPTWAGEVAGLSGRLGRHDAAGLFHGTAQGDTNWAAFSRFLADAAGLPNATVEPVSASALKLKARRPRMSVMISRRLPEVGLAALPPWQEHVRGYLAKEAAAGPG
jgi:dTDP-4-dehydrorhamnose reductase